MVAALLLRTPPTVAYRDDAALASQLLSSQDLPRLAKGPWPRFGLPVSEKRLYVNGLEGGDPAVINLVLAVIEATGVVLVSLSLFASSNSLLLSSVISASSSGFAQDHSYDDFLSLFIHIGR